MTICEAATRFDEDSYYKTTVNEETEEATIIGEMNGKPVEFTLGGGGGGSSDFSTAEVTVVNSSLFPIEPKRAVLSCCEANQLGEGLPAMVYPSVPTVGNGVTAKITVPLYKGSCAWTYQPFGDTYSYTLAGDIDDSMGMYLITGDCTITVRESI